MFKMIGSIVFLILFILIDQEIVESAIIHVPSDAMAMVNESIYFNCSTSMRPFDERSLIWFHYPLDGGGQRNYVYDDGNIMSNYRNRFSIDKDPSLGKFNLVIMRLERKDAGRYECRDDALEDTGASSELTVLESNLVCESDMDPGGIVGPTQCKRAVAPDEVQLSCSVSYNGKYAPEMLWRTSDNTSASNKADCVKRDNHVTCNTTLTANLQMNRVIYICETSAKLHSCSLEIKNIQYVLSGNETVDIAMDEEVTCSASTSQSCSYEWIWFNESDSVSVSTNQTLDPTRLGSHRCEATCDVGKTSCVLDVMFVEVSRNEVHPIGVSLNAEAVYGRHEQLLFLILIAILFVIILIVIIVIVLLCRRRKRRQDRGSTSPNLEANRNNIQSTSPEEKVHLKAEEEDANHGQSETDISPDVETLEPSSNNIQSAPTIEMVHRTAEEDDANHGQSASNIPLSHNETNICSIENPVLMKTIRTKAAENNRKGISGLAIAEDELYVTNFQTKDIEVFDLKELTLTRSWSLEPLVNSYDLGYCNINKCLYVMDLAYSNTTKKIFRVERNGKLTRRWTTGMLYGCISVTYDGNILMSEYEGHSIIEYTPDGHVILEINLPTTEFLHPRHAIKLPGGQYLMSHGEMHDPLHRVCVMDASGKILRSFGGEGGSPSYRLFTPIYLAINSTRSIFVVYRDNSRVLLLDPDLKSGREIILTEKNGFDRPERMILDQANGRLLLAHNDIYWSECKIYVYDIPQPEADTKEIGKQCLYRRSVLDEKSVDELK